MGALLLSRAILLIIVGVLLGSLGLLVPAGTDFGLFLVLVLILSIWLRI